MKVIIKNSEERESSKGGSYKSGMLFNGTADVGFLAFPRFKDYTSIQEGAEINCVLTPTKKGDKFFVNDVANNLGPKPAWANGAKKQEGIKEAQNIKREDIKTAQGRTQEGVKMSGSARDATLIVTTFYRDNGMAEDDIKAKWEEWRKWFYQKYDEPFI